MFEFVYSPVVLEKLSELKEKLTVLCGEKKAEKKLTEIVDGFEIRFLFSNTGIPVKTLYEVEAEFEDYYIIFSHKNYFLYYIVGKTVHVMEVYDEREDFAKSLFGIITTSQETLDYWKE